MGDPRQLPATVLDPQAASAGLSTSLFERLERSSHEVVMLQIQYRMHRDIRVFPSERFYGGNLFDSDIVGQMALPKRQAPDPLSTPSDLLRAMHAPKYRITVTPPSGSLQKERKVKEVALLSPTNNRLYLKTVEFFDISNSCESRDTMNSKTLVNDTEARFICSMLTTLGSALNGLTVGVITPYEGQKRLLRNLVSGLVASGNLPRSQVEVNTVDSFQGREKDLVIISCVRTSRAGIGFLDDDRRMNVAITRAKRSVVVVGNAAALKNSLSWKSLVDHCKEYNCFNSLTMSKV